MGWFSRRRERDDEGRPEPARPPLSASPASPLGPPAGVDAGPELPDDVVDDGKPLRPVVARLGAQERARIARAVEELEGQGVSLDDLESLGAAYDRAYSAWLDAPDDSRPDHGHVVDTYAIGVGEHLHRHTDLDWGIVTDVFGTDLAVTGGRGAFVVVPSNLVAARWMRGETGWLPGVVGHMVERRSRR